MPRVQVDPDYLKIEKVVQLKPVSKTVKGGRKRRFSSLMVVGDGNGHVGVGMGKSASRARFDSQRIGKRRQEPDRSPDHSHDRAPSSHRAQRQRARAAQTGLARNRRYRRACGARRIGSRRHHRHLDQIDGQQQRHQQRLRGVGWAATNAKSHRRGRSARHFDGTTGDSSPSEGCDTL